jgi:uncharacterized protein YlxW (UPF0749 family)
MTDETEGPDTTHDPPDDGPRHGRSPKPTARSSTLVKVVIAVLCGLLGFAAALQFRRTADGDTLAAARPDDLVQILDGLQRREDELNSEIADLQEVLARLNRSGASSEEALAEARRQAEALGILAGTLPASGPGVRITMTDPDSRVTPEVLLDAIQELRNAGAEAFAVGDVRIGTESAFTGQAGAVQVDGVPVSAPYVIVAIGDPPTLSAALSIPGGVLDTVRRAGGSLEIVQQDAVDITALRPSRAPLYARPAG